MSNLKTDDDITGQLRQREYFSFPIKPVAWQRAVHWKGRTLTPTATRRFQSQIRKMLPGMVPFEGPLKVEAIFWYQRPKTSKRKYPNIRPDIDNLWKSVSDAFNGYVWKDDAQVVVLKLEKAYSLEGKDSITVVVHPVE
jgi:Holliday junction resolvase RusA-like endonuclease